jgi:long-subunit fatty acid transport protein
MTNNKLRRFFCFLLLLLAFQYGQAQTGSNSPYSRFGIGKLESKSVNARLQAMGGISTAISSNRFVNPSNPASYAGFDSLSFLLNTGFNMGQVNFKTNTQSEIGNYASINYFSIGFPINHWWHTALGVLPFSKVGYNVEIPYTNELTGNYTKDFTGDGGLNQVYLGNAFTLGDHFSLGANITYIFGRYTSSAIMFFPDSSLYANTKASSRVLASDFIFDFGLLYNTKLGNDYKLNLGATYSQKINLNVKQDFLLTSMFGGVDGNVEYIIDTILYNPNAKGKLVLPASIGIGAVLEKSDRWLVGADFNWQNWKNFSAFGINDSLNNSWKVSAGGQYTPNFSSISGYWKRVTYRGGLRYNQTYLQFDGVPIMEFGVSVGLGLPLPRTLTTVDLSLEVGRTGTTNHDLIQENFVNFTVGVSLYERWFVKRKYD